MNAHRTTSPPAIEAAGLRKRFGSDVGRALDGLDLVAPAGAGHRRARPERRRQDDVRPRRGHAAAPRRRARCTSPASTPSPDPEQVRRVIGLAGQYAAVEPALTGRENLVMVARLFGHGRAGGRGGRRRRCSTSSASTDAADRLVRGYSGGMRRRLDLGASLVGAPRLLLLDEPTTGLDPRSRIELWDAIRALVAAGTDVLLTTQYLEEADQLADHVVIIDHGRAIATGTPDELKGRAGRDVVEIRVRRRRRPRRAPPSCSPRSAPRRRAVDEPARRVAVAGRRRHRPAGRRRAGARRRRHRDRRHRPAPPDPRRGVPRPHRSPADDRRPATDDRRRPTAADRRLTGARR